MDMPISRPVASHWTAPRRLAPALWLMITGLAASSLSACGGDGKARADRAAPADTATKVVRQVPGPAATPMRSPDTFQVRFETSKGPFLVSVERKLAPHGADRFYELVTIGFFDEVRFYRIVPGFVAQFGKHGTVSVNDAWVSANIPDDPMRISNEKGTVAFAANGPNSRSTELFISTGDNTRKLDYQKLFAPIGRVTEGMDVVERLNAEYGEEPNFARIARQGNAYLAKWFPALDYIKTAALVDGSVETDR